LHQKSRTPQPLEPVAIIPRHPHTRVQVEPAHLCHQPARRQLQWPAPPLVVVAFARTPLVDAREGSPPTGHAPQSLHPVVARDFALAF
jgi:hypothetical protein